MQNFLQTTGELKATWLEIFFNNQDVVTKVADTSVVAAHGYASAKLGQKALLATALLEAHLLPDAARGDALDEACELFGISPRFQATGSSTYVRLTADPGTRYQVGLHSFSGTHGQIFDLVRDSLVGAYGYTYALVRSRLSGAQTNVEALSITTVTSAPASHAYVVNEYQATGGRDAEDDATLRQRMKNGPNLLAQTTEEAIAQVLLRINPNVLRVQPRGRTLGGRFQVAVIPQNGADFTPDELGAMSRGLRRYLNLADQRPDGLGGFAVELINPAWYPIDISVRGELPPGAAAATALQAMQQATQHLLDYRYWPDGETIPWTDLLDACKPFLLRYADQLFTPRQDLAIPRGYLPRVRGFLLLDLRGGLLAGQNSNLNPFFYPREADFSYQRTALLSLPPQ